MARTVTEARREGETALAKRGFVRGVGRDVATWFNHETGEVGRLQYVPDHNGDPSQIVEVRFQAPPVDGLLPNPTTLIKF
jgi:hypothetical protein